MNNHINMLSTANNPGIPLHCTICPKKPNFSDVSHLLTHVASKGHLSHYYKMKVKGSTDAHIKGVVDEYDEWYDDWHVEDLMMQRMNQKEKRKSGVKVNGAGSSRRASGAKSGASTRSTPLIREVSDRRARAQRESTLDPQLGPRIKVEPRSRSGTPVCGFGLDAAAVNRAYAPPMQGWPASPYPRSPTSGLTSVQDSLYSTPSSDSGEYETPRPSAGRRKRRSTSGPQSSLDAEDEFGPDGEVLLKDKEAKLKGVFWDGMGMFDSATPDMKRKRNQKKAISVIETLQATSEIVTATEQVFDADGELQRERPITGEPEDDDGFSPLKGESPPIPLEPHKKKPGRRPRKALTEKNVNTSRITRRGGGGAHYPSFTDRDRKTPYFDGPDDDDALTYGSYRPRKRQGLSIHRDDSGPEITFNNRASMTTLNSSLRNPLQVASDTSHFQPPRQSGMFGRGHQRQPSLPSTTSFRSGSNYGNPLGLPPPNFGSFGQLNGQSLFQNQNPFALSNGHHGFAPFPQHFNFAPSTFGEDQHNFQSHGSGSNHGAWDVFGSGQFDLSMPSGMSNGFHGSGDFTSVNPMIFSSAHAEPQDDEVTISPPDSQRER